MATLSSVSVEFIANVAKYTEGLLKMKKQTAEFSAGIQKDVAAASATLSKIGMAAAAAGAALYTGIAVGVGKSIEEISKLKDEADKVGATAEGFMLLTSAAQKSGAGAENMRKAMFELTKSLGEAFQAGSQTSEEFTRLGIDIIKLNALSADKQFVAVAEALNRIPDRTERARIGTALLGKEYTQLAIVIKEINNLDAPIGKALSQKDIENIKAAGESFDNLKESVIGIFNILAAGFGPLLTEIFDSLSKSMKDFMQDGSAMMNIFSAMATPILMVAGAIDYFRAGIKLGEVYILTLGQVVAKIFRGIVNSVTEGIEAIINLTNKSIEAINKFAGKELFSPFGKDYLNRLRADANNTVDVFTETVKKSRKELDDIMPGGKESYFTKTLDFFSTGISGAIGVATRAATTTLGNAKKELEAVVLSPTPEKYKSTMAFGFADLTKRIKEFNDQNPEPLGKFSMSILKSNDQVGNSTEKMVTKQDNQTRHFLFNLEKMGTEVSDKLKKAVDDADYQLTKMGEAMTVSVEKPMETYQRELTNINYLLEKNKISTETAARATMEAYEKMVQASNIFFEPLKSFGESIAGNFMQAIEGAKSFGDAMHDIMKNVAQDILNVILKQLLLKSLFNAIGVPLFGIQNMGQLMYGGPRAGGGPVNTGKAYMVGENGPEMFIPNTGGYIVPNGMRNSDGGTTVVQNISVQAGVSQTVRAEMAALLPRFKSEAMAGVIEAKSRGGSYGRALAA